MDLTEDSIKEICSRMNVNSLYDFIQTSQQNHNLCVNIFNLKYYEEMEYPKLNELYDIKIYILELLDIVPEGNVLALSPLFVDVHNKNPDRYPYGINYDYRQEQEMSTNKLYKRLPNFPRIYVRINQKNIYNKSITYPDMYNQINEIMTIEDPDIKLNYLEQLV